MADDYLELGLPDPREVELANADTMSGPRGRQNSVDRRAAVSTAQRVLSPEAKDAERKAAYDRAMAHDPTQPQAYSTGSTSNEDKTRFVQEATVPLRFRQDDYDPAGQVIVSATHNPSVVSAAQSIADRTGLAAYARYLQQKQKETQKAERTDPELRTEAKSLKAMYTDANPISGPVDAVRDATFQAMGQPSLEVQRAENIRKAIDAAKASQPVDAAPGVRQPVSFQRGQ